MKTDVFKLLERKDKWYLGGGNRMIWTPAFPNYLDYPGAWDALSYFDFKLEPGYTVNIVKDGAPVDFKFNGRLWNPASLRSNFESEDLELIDEKVVLKDDFMGSVITIRNKSNIAVELDVVLWTAQPTTKEASEPNTEFVDISEKALTFKRRFSKPRRKPYEAGAALAMEDFDSYNVSFSDRTGNLPNFRLSPFYEKLSEKGLLKAISTEGITETGLLYFGLHRKLNLEPGKEVSFNCGLSIAPKIEQAHIAVEKNLNKDIIQESRKNWQKIFDSVPQFSIDDPYLQKYYYYRWYGLKLFTTNVDESCMSFPAVAEGLDYFRAFITYSAQCHMLETRWSNSPAIGQGSLLNFIKNQREDGSFVGHIYINQLQENGFYHADWGRAVMELQGNHPDIDFLKKIYEPLKRYLGYFDNVRDRENSGLYDVVDQFETGQEFMSRYTIVDPMADRYGWINNIRLKGVDATVYIYNLKKALVSIAKELGKEDEALEFEKSAQKTKTAVRKYMWDPQVEMFSDVRTESLERTGIKAAVCFYPYMTDIVDESHLPGLKKHLLNPEEFWTEYPVPATSADDPTFSPWAEWKGKRHNCPWNGRTWPMTNSHIADALGICAKRFNDDLLKEKTVEFINKFIRMMYYEGDLERPNCFEHYNPFNGKASVFRGVDDYQHSWVVDLFFRYIAGININEEGIEIDPMPFKSNFKIDNLMIRDIPLSIDKTDDSFVVRYGSEVIDLSKEHRNFFSFKN